MYDPRTGGLRKNRLREENRPVRELFLGLREVQGNQRGKRGDVTPFKRGETRFQMAKRSKLHGY